MKAAQGVKIAARELEKAIAGLNLQVSYHEDEVDLLKEEVDKEFKAAMRSIKVSEFEEQRLVTPLFFSLSLFSSSFPSIAFSFFTVSSILLSYNLVLIL